MFRDYHIKNFNFKLLVLVVLAITYGTIIINSADPSYLKKQVLGIMICSVAFIIVTFIDYNIWERFMWIFYVLNILMLFAVRFTPLGKSVNNAKRWFAVGSSFTIQPSEFSKIILILFMAFYLQKHKEDLNTLKRLSSIAVLCAIPLFLIFKQPDLSTTLDIAFILFIMIYIAGLSHKLIGIALIVLIPVFSVFLWYVQTPGQKLLAKHQRERILTFLHPNEYTTSTGWQQYNSVMAIGSGMLKGKGLNNNNMATVKEANLISEQQTDFIFSVVGEELGFIGCIILIAILLFIVLQCIKVGRKAKNDAGMLIASGVGALVCIQSFINIGVATSILPNTGLPLPFISYGLSSLLSTMVGMGLIMNISFQRRKY